MTVNQASINAAARDKALASAALTLVQPTALVEYRSQGRVVVIAGDQATPFATGDQQHPSLSEMLLTSGIVKAGDVIFPAAGTPIAVNGYLGEFLIAVGTPGTVNYELIKSDLILDLGVEPVVKTPVKPPGYLLADSREEGSVRAALDQLRELVGSFEKPRYFDLDTNICAHSRSGQVGCTRCLDTCPAQAITSLGETLDVDPHLCQGAGVCATVCPTGAIRYAYPNAADTLQRVRRLLERYRAEGGQNPVIAFIAAADSQQVNEWPDTLLPVTVEELASVGMDTWLGCIVSGAAVVLLDAGSVPEGVDYALREQLSFAQSLLTGMHYDAGLIQFTTVDDLQSYAAPAMPDIALATYASINGKRQAILLATDHLRAQAGKPELAEAEVALPANAPFGRIQVDTELCTLCMGCTSVCPSSAVHAAGDLPRLLFTEVNCTQCGLCQSACPEQAIQLQPRLLTDPQQRRTAVVLNEESPFLCVSCNKPFATQSIINKIMAKVSGHSMFQSERAKQRLLMCEDCRVVDVVQDADAMLAASGGRGQDESTREH